MRTVRRLLYRQILSSVLFVTLAFLALFFFIDLVDELQQAIRLARHRGHDNGDLVPLSLRRETACRHVLHALDRADRCPAILLDDQHGRGLYMIERP